jgi:hypothetical protein
MLGAQMKTPGLPGVCFRDVKPLRCTGFAHPKPASKRRTVKPLSWTG